MVNSHTEKVLGSSPSLINRLNCFSFVEIFASMRNLGWTGFWCAVLLFWWGGASDVKREKIGVG